MGYTTLHPTSVNQVHHVDLHIWRVAPQNLGASRPIEILVNQGYIVGFSPERLQRVAQRRSFLKT